MSSPPPSLPGPGTPVAFVGLGTMGAPMAANLAQAGFALTVHNRTREREEALAARGASRAASPAEAARTGFLVTCVSDSLDLEEVLFEGEFAAIHGLPEGALVIDCSTVAPATARRAAERLAERSIGFLDAPVSGGSEGAIRGTLAIMCGGREEDFERARPLLAAMGSSAKLVGPAGSGQVAKAVNQVIIAGTYQSVAEGLSLAAKSGVDPRAVVDAIGGGAAASWVLEQRAENMIEDRYPLGFRLRHHRKDLGLALDAGREAGASLPLAALVAAFEDGLIATGSGDEDLSALARAVRRASGLPEGPLTHD